MTFSVVVPIYNKEKYLVKCIESVVNQTYKDFEIILVDDGSTDKSAEICDMFAEKYDFIKATHKQNQGLVRARITGVDVSIGEYITFVDSDDYIEPERLEKAAKCLENFSYDIICTGYTSLKNGIYKKVNNKIHADLKTKSKAEEIIYSKMMSVPPFFEFGIHPSACMKFIKRDLIKESQKNLPKDITWGEDLALTYPCILKADSIKITDDCSYVYVNNNDSMTMTYDEKMVDRILLLFEYIESFKEVLNWKCSQQLQDYVAMITEIVIRNEFSANKNYNAKHNQQIEKYKKHFLVRRYIKKIIISKKYSKKLRIKAFMLRHSLYSLLYSVTKKV